MTDSSPDADPRIALSVLDLSPIPSGSTSGDALRNTIDLAQHAERLGYTRYWLAEHHNTAGIASSVPEIMIGHVAEATSTIRVGSGGIMLPNHAPLRVAESFRVLEALHPGRIDLGLGRAPGTDGITALALRRSREALTADDFPEQLGELIAFLTNGFESDHPFSRITPSPDDVGNPDLYLLGSSGYSAQAAAVLGLGFAFAHHINPAYAIDALRAYRENFRPSDFYAEPHAILGVSVICGDTDAAAEELASTVDLMWLRITSGQTRQKLPSVAEAKAYPWTPAENETRLANRDRTIVGGPDTVHARITELTGLAGVDEVMVMTVIHDHAARRHSYELLADVFGVTGGSGTDPRDHIKV